VRPTVRAFAAVLLLAGAAALARAGEVVVLKGGTVVPLKEHWVRRGNTAYLTRADGTLLSVPVSEIDREKTAAANRAVPAAPAPAAAPAPSTPAEAVRAPRDTPKAKVRITDADVSHPLELDTPAGEEKKDQAAGPGGAKVELADYTQEKTGSNLIVKGKIRNVGQIIAQNVRMSMTAIDDKGESIEATNAILSKGSVEPGRTIDFTGTMNVGEKTVASVRFSPQWSVPPPPPAPTARPGTAAAAAAAQAAEKPAPVPTPFGRGTIYAAPVANAPSQAPADGKTGYIPGATSPDNQPKPPSR
jgi:hypothetical protein